jgi:hypothetical protein
VSDGLAYVADGYSGLRVIDVTEPGNLQEVGHHDVAGNNCGVTVSGDTAYVTDSGARELRIIHYYGSSPGTEETQPARTRAPHLRPTLAGRMLALGGQALAELHDISGRRVMDLRPGANDVRGLAPGVYFVREAQAQAQAVRKVVVTR